MSAAATQLLDNLATAIVLVDVQLRISYLNTAAESLLEISGSRCEGEPLEQFFREQDTDGSGLERAAASGAGYTKRQTRLQLASGQQTVVDYIVTPIGDNACGGFVVEIQPLDRLLSISRDEALVSAQEMTRTMIRGLAHEIKNPLGGLRGAAQLLARELPSEQLQDYTNVIIDEADRLRRLVDRMLGSALQLQRDRVNVHEVTERVRQLIEAECSERIRIERDYDPSIPELLADKEQLIQATLNIARNAVQALGDHKRVEPPARLLFRTRAQRQCTIGGQHHRLVCRLDICDNGPGIPTEITNSLFFPMVSGRPEGTGLGLAIAQSILNQHDGIISCSSEPGDTVFSLYLPIETPS